MSAPEPARTAAPRAAGGRPANRPRNEVIETERLLVQGRFGDPVAALAELEQYLPGLQRHVDPEAWPLGLYARAFLMRLAGANKAEVVAAWTMLESAAAERQLPVWVAMACAMRARTRLESGEAGAAMGDLARIHLDALTDELTSIAGFRLLDAAAAAFARIRLFDRADDARSLLEATIGGHEPLDQATHWATWAAELAARALEPVARGAADPEPRLLDRAVQIAERVIALGVSPVPEPLRRIANGVRALSASYRGQPTEALKLLGSDAFGEPLGLQAPESQLLVVAALHAHTLVGSHATARSLDESVSRQFGSLPNIVLEVCRARERLWLEREARGDLSRPTTRLTDLLVRLSWQGMELAGETARQAMEHQLLVTESRTDALTGVGNRRALDEEMAAMLRFTQLPVAMVLVDLDDFKQVNDTFTHLVGDEVLRQVARTLSEQVGPGDRLVRYGGDEFVVLLPGAGDAEATKAARRMSRAIHTLPWDSVASGLRVRVTTGCAALYALTGRRPAADAERLFRRADEALLEAKRRSRVSLPAPGSVMPDAIGVMPEEATESAESAALAPPPRERAKPTSARARKRATPTEGGSTKTPRGKGAASSTTPAPASTAPTSSAPASGATPPATEVLDLREAPGTATTTPAAGRGGDLKARHALGAVPDDEPPEATTAEVRPGRRSGRRAAVIDLSSGQSTAAASSRSSSSRSATSRD